MATKEELLKLLYNSCDNLFKQAQHQKIEIKVPCWYGSSEGGGVVPLLLTIAMSSDNKKVAIEGYISIQQSVSITIVVPSEGDALRLEGCDASLQTLAETLGVVNAFGKQALEPQRSWRDRLGFFSSFHEPSPQSHGSPAQGVASPNPSILVSPNGGSRGVAALVVPVSPASQPASSAIDPPSPVSEFVF